MSNFLLLGLLLMVSTGRWRGAGEHPIRSLFTLLAIGFGMLIR